MMAGVISGFKPAVIIADELYDFNRNFFREDEMSEEEIKAHAKEVAMQVVKKL